MKRCTIRQVEGSSFEALASTVAILLFFLSSCPLFAPPYTAPEPGNAVVVVYNSLMPESKAVADYYAQRRQIPHNQVFGFDLPLSESMSRTEFIKKLQLPLWQKLQQAHLLTLGPLTNVPVPPPPLAQPRRVTDAAFRYITLCYGVPTKVLRDTNLVEVLNNIPDVFRRNEASVDSDLACLPLTEQNMRWTGPNVNPFYGITNAAMLTPANGIVLVTRLDGPSPAIARGLVDKAMEAETNGLWGRAYFDSRGLTSGGYKLGDDWLRDAAHIARSLGFETELDERPETFSPGHPMSHIAFYAGWYDEHVSGPFTQPHVEFMPGAFAYHLHSFSAQILRTANQHWVGPLLQQGATITLGSVDEPYLQGTPDISMFISRLLYHGFSFGEAAYAAQNAVSWQNIAVGDPLYRPFGKHPGLIQFDLEQRGSKLLDLAQLRLVNLEQVAGTNFDELISTLQKLPLTQTSAVLTEKLGDLLAAQNKLPEAVAAYEKALLLNPTPQQKIRLLLTLAEKRAASALELPAYETYQRLLREHPTYPDRLTIYKKLLPLAQKLQKHTEAEEFRILIDKLSPKPSVSPK